MEVKTKGQGQLRIKEDMEIEKYGGYKDIYAAYYFIVQHTTKNKTVKTIEPAYIYQLKQYESDPIKYCETVLDLVNPKIIIPKLLINSVIEFNGSRLILKGRSGPTLLLQHNYQFALDDSNAKYFKEIEKSLEKISSNKLIDISDDMIINSEKNVEMYDMLVSRLRTGVYKPLFNKMISTLEVGRATFKEINETKQIIVLNEILNAYKCDRQSSNLKEIGGPSSAGILTKGKTLQDGDTIYVINQSPTGLYETKVKV